jgi:hypothetical protein
MIKNTMPWKGMVFTTTVFPILKRNLKIKKYIYVTIAAFTVFVLGVQRCEKAENNSMTMLKFFRNNYLLVLDN